MLLLFDIDGTLISPHGTGSRATKLAGQKLFGPDFSFGNIDSSGKIDPQIFGELIEVNDSINISWNDHRIFQGVYLEMLVAELKKGPIPALPGVLALLETLRGMDGVTLRAPNRQLFCCGVPQARKRRF
jgi:phosphoglycolate phosphatase-like HAD superfamily hydrolase